MTKSYNVIMKYNNLNLLFSLSKKFIIFLPLMLLSSCSNFLTNSENFLCVDSKGTVDNFILEVQRSFFANSNLMKIPSRVVTLGATRTICSENETAIFAGDNCRGNDFEKQSLIFSKNNGKLEIYVTPTIVRRSTCELMAE
tara:strand:+ start:719 stop:1141 length:423 start_codon:yes stop_codon:yes gene_type:complete